MRIHDGLPHQRPSRGAVMVEVAIVLPILFMFLIGTITIGIGIFRYEQVAMMAREGARYASVHGSLYAFETGGSVATSALIKSNAVVPVAVGLNATDITVTATPTTVGAPGSIIQVTVLYNWTPGIYITGTIPLSSTSKMVVSY